MASAPPNKPQNKDSGTSGDSKKDTEDDDGACSGATCEETSAKSLNEDFSFGPPGFSFNSSPEADAASHHTILENQLSSLGINSRPSVFNESIGAYSMPFNPVHPGKTVPIGMNILPDSGQRINNTDVLVGIAERQLSFQSRPSCRDSLPPIQHERPTQESAMSGIGASRPALDSNDDYSDLKDSWEENISLSTQGARVVTARADATPHTEGSNNLTERAAPPTASSSISHISIRSEIPPNCLVRKLPRRIITLVASHLQIRQLQGTWKELVEMHGWDYQRTYLFQHENHEEGIFFSLLRQPEFQTYTLENLRQDLYNLPRRDVLHDLNEIIGQHNEFAVNQRGSQTR